LDGAVAVRSNDSGFSLIEVFVVMVVTLIMAAFLVPKTSALFGNLRISGDARGIANTTALAKMRAAADFTRARLYVNLPSLSYRLERFERTPPGWWVAESGWTPLSSGVNLGFAALAAPPPNTQGAIAQAPQCLDDAGNPIGNTACIVFNSRGIPVDNGGLPTANDAVYINGTGVVYGVTVAATGQIRVWKSGGAGVWSLQ
jgi:prepilin-type N-terminal cleavage/methylation domain-containing protein